MRVITADGAAFDLGATEMTPTVSILDYSRRVTDDFGVTTVVERGFSRRLSARLMLTPGSVDQAQRRLAALRAVEATWEADDRFAWLSTKGFYKDFSIDFETSELAYCSLSVEGLAETEIAPDPGTDPAIDGQSTMRLLAPVVLADNMLVSSTIAENDAPAWSGATTYALGARVVRAHRVFESLKAGNQEDPATGAGGWLDTGPTNRWAMFDQALGTVASAAGQIRVVLSAGTIDAVALLDVVGATVRVQAGAYDRTSPVGEGALTFLDVPATSGQVTVTIAGPDTVSVGTLLVGRLYGLGRTEAQPTAGITDFSRKEVDEFGEVTVVPRAWAKRMEAKALIRTDALDVVANRIAAVRARPCLWIGLEGLDSLTVYGFWKDFSIEVGTTSKLSLSVEGLSKAAPIVPLEFGKGDKGDPGEPGQDGKDGLDGKDGRDAPLVIVQWSVDGQTNWHSDYQEGDKFQRQSNDNGVTYGPAVRVVGENANSGQDGITTSIVFRRSATIPPTPARDTGNPPTGWSDAPPQGSGLLWQSVSRFRGATQLEGWSAPVRITGPSGKDGASSLVLIPSFSGFTNGNVIGKNVDAGPGDFATVVSANALSGGAILSFTIPDGNHSMAIGLSTNPNFEPFANNLDFGFELSVFEPNRANFGIRERDSFRSIEFTSGGQFQIHYDGRSVRYLYNGTVVDSHIAAPDLNLYVDSAFTTPGATATITGFASSGSPGAPGLDGTDGIDGTNGQSIHIAYADSADGSVNFTTGEAGGRSFIGVYTDTNPGADSPNPASYGWTRLRGLNGEQGLRGPGGYVHLAYANSSDGTVDFHLSDPTGRRYLGSYTDQAEADSADPARYSWSLIKGADGAPGTDGYFAALINGDTATVRCSFDGTPLPGQTAAVVNLIQLRKGADIVLSGVVYSLAFTDGCSVSFNPDNGRSDLTAITKDIATFVLRAAYQGRNYDRTITVKKVADGKAGQAGFTRTEHHGFSTTTFVQFSVLDLVVPANQAVKIAARIDYEAQSLAPNAQFRGGIKLSVQDVTASGAETDISGSIVDGSQAIYTYSVDAQDNVTETNSPGQAVYDGSQPAAASVRTLRLRLYGRKLSSGPRSDAGVLYAVMSAQA